MKHAALFFLPAILVAAGSADAGVYRVSVVGDWTWDKQPPFAATFLIDTGQAPADADPWYFRYMINALVDGVPASGFMDFYESEGERNDFWFKTPGVSLNSEDFSPGGCPGPMFSGTTFAPTLIVGTFKCFEYVDWGTTEFIARHRLEIAEIPEPATWGLLVAGFGLVGSSMRRKQATARAGAR